MTRRLLTLLMTLLLALGAVACDSDDAEELEDGVEAEAGEVLEEE